MKKKSYDGPYVGEVYCSPYSQKWHAQAVNQDNDGDFHSVYGTYNFRSRAARAARRMAKKQNKIFSRQKNAEKKSGWERV